MRTTVPEDLARLRRSGAASELGPRKPAVRTRICAHWRNGHCVRGERCGFAHGNGSLGLPIDTLQSAGDLPAYSELCATLLRRDEELAVVQNERDRVLGDLEKTRETLTARATHDDTLRDAQAGAGRLAHLLQRICIAVQDSGADFTAAGRQAQLKHSIACLQSRLSPPGASALGIGGEHMAGDGTDRHATVLLDKIIESGERGNDIVHILRPFVGAATAVCWREPYLNKLHVQATVGRLFVSFAALGIQRIHLIVRPPKPPAESCLVAVNRLRAQLSSMPKGGVHFSFAFNDSAHSRCSSFNNGIKFWSSEGLDLYQAPEGPVDRTDWSIRKCCAASLQVSISLPPPPLELPAEPLVAGAGIPTVMPAPPAASHASGSTWRHWRHGKMTSEIMETHISATQRGTDQCIRKTAAAAALAGCASGEYASAAVVSQHASDTQVSSGSQSDHENSVALPNSALDTNQPCLEAAAVDDSVGAAWNDPIPPRPAPV